MPWHLVIFHLLIINKDHLLVLAILCIKIDLKITYWLIDNWPSLTCTSSTFDLKISHGTIILMSRPSWLWCMMRDKNIVYLSDQIWSTKPPCVQVNIPLISIQEGKIFRGAHLQWSFRLRRREVVWHHHPWTNHWAPSPCQGTPCTGLHRVEAASGLVQPTLA